jgi:hypothetical protein
MSIIVAATYSMFMFSIVERWNLTGANTLLMGLWDNLFNLFKFIQLKFDDCIPIQLMKICTSWCGCIPIQLNLVFIVMMTAKENA